MAAQMIDFFPGATPLVHVLAALIIGILCVVLNLVAAKTAEFFGTMVFLDTVGTAIAAFVCGPVTGVCVGAVTNVATGRLLFAGYICFFYVNAFCGLAWGLLFDNFDSKSSDTKVILFVLTVGGIVGLISAILATPLRIFMKFRTDHLLDKIGGPMITVQPDAKIYQRIPGWLKVLSSELLLSHLLDKVISTAVGMMVVLEVIKLFHLVTSATPDPVPLYHDLMDFLAAYYYVALAIVVKTLHVDVVAPANAGPQGQIFVLLGPLGIFSMLLGLPVLLRIVTQILMLIAGVSE
jgi:hypothetical protein